MNTDPELEVHVAEDEMIVAQPGSAYAVTFYKLDGSPQLLARDIAKRDNPSVEMTLISDLSLGLCERQMKRRASWGDRVKAEPCLWANSSPAYVGRNSMSAGDAAAVIFFDEHCANNGGS